ncbi:disulfide bond formation protein DsbA [Candidatus Beckwithbacteria bacterium CG10_big_fil_rev_8_21_14_0_10_34_10]|uniref:Disulfide bond formation protein DsbA n=1 Tax=Candidatus Beckwithbacteria bacterium CG10_big_fil_rev_8_21_14_0_10_34_10 TaxID=1974495 RepID=A0A2H0W7W8_9BACT|nr:MAG: disulfide bond formation protein DsbA [Candidatus Beckwithbacteria bacterium CG10_big_fil_rev_8_21_14_0_10_34_10]
MESNKITPILIAALIFAAFVSGSLWNKVRNLESEKEEQKAEEMVQAPEAAPEEPQVLGVEDQAEIVAEAAAVKGLDGAKVTIVEFSEYQCPFCKRYVDSAYKRILDEYGEEIRYVFRDYPLPFHPNAQITSEAARCAGEQGDYWSYHDKLFEDQETWSNLDSPKETLVGYAGTLGLNQANFQTCLNNGTYIQAIKDDVSLGQKMGVSGTPTFFINGQKLVGAQPFENFKTTIDQELAK